ncbi:MAG TPA: hypothetical protein VFC78_21855 [Tepidisphaeraceae bacterium]|nr:hypothetical protein [Tepidisphaeraceae bacterium]
MNVRYFDECKWNDVADGLIFEFVDDSGQKLAEVALRNAESKLWKFEVFVPEQYQLDGTHPAGAVYTCAAAKRVAETILLNTIVVRS